MNLKGLLSGLLKRRGKTSGLADSCSPSNLPSGSSRQVERSKKPSLPLASDSELDEVDASLDRGDLLVARTLLEAAGASTSNKPTLLLRWARLERLSGHSQLAIDACEMALLVADSASAVQTERAHALVALPDLEAAIDAVHVAIELDAANGDAWLLLGQILQRLDSKADALRAFEQARTRLKKASDIARCLRLIGAIKVETLDSVGAKEALEASLLIEPENADAHLGLGISALWLDDEPAALLHFESAVARTQRPSNLLLMNLAYALQHTGRLAEAHSVYSRLVARDPRDHAVRWYLCQLDLALCNWRAGWAHIDSRFTSGATSYRPIGYRPWDGRDISGQTLLILADEGLGDEILYASCIPDAQARAGRLIVECEPRLQQLFSRSFPGVITIATRRENNAGWLDGLPEPDWQIPSGNLPGIFRLSDSDFPEHRGYLRTDDEKTRLWRETLTRSLGSGLKIGISWRGGTAKTRQHARTIASRDWAPILSTPNVHFVNLQYGDYQAELAKMNELYPGRIHNFPEALADYDETAALVQALDVVVTVCTAVVHLAGALGRPVWVLAPLVPGWRYTANRDVMPWYPSSRLFRQRTWGDWGPACREVSNALSDMTKIVTLG